MCGIVGLYLKNPDLQGRLGTLFCPMLIEMTDRGADSAGIAIYRKDGDVAVKIAAYSPDSGLDWRRLAEEAGRDLGIKVSVRRISTYAVLSMSSDSVNLREWLERNHPEIRITSSGQSLEVYKETGLPETVLERFGVAGMTGTHALGHTRMATESAVTTAGAHPFNTGDDLCLVHNGSLSNHHLWRGWLAKEAGITFQTENDSEVAAAYLTWRLRQGATLSEALEACLGDLDGFFTFAVGTGDGFSVVRDPISCKHAIMAETDDWVAMSTEYRALARLPGVKGASVWEPKPATVYSWGRA